MVSVVVELQREALDRSVKVSDLLRKALVVARKLKLAEFQQWIEDELNGYKKTVPDYRMVKGNIRGWNPYNGWIPLIFENAKEGELLSNRASGQSIAEIESLVEHGSDTFHMPFSQEIQRKLSKGFGFDTEISLFVSQTSLIRTLDAVRNIVLNWALKLEEDGVMGEDMSFSVAEREAAIQIPQNVNNFYGPVGNPQISQGNESSIQMQSTSTFDPKAVRAFADAVIEALPNLRLDDNYKNELEADIDTIRAQLKSSNPKKSILKETLFSIKNILENAAGSAIGQMLIENAQTILG